MRAAIIGTYFADDAKARLEFGTRAARLTHTDERAVAGALFVAELAAQCSETDPTADRFQFACGNQNLVAFEISAKQ